MGKIMRLILLIALLLLLILINYIRDYIYPSEDNTNDEDAEEEQLKIHKAMDAIKKAADRVSDFTIMVGPKVNRTLDNVTQAISEVSNVVTKDLWFQVNNTMANINEKLNNLDQKVAEVAQVVMDDMWPCIKETMTNFSKNVDKVSDALTHKVWLTVNETIGTILRLLDVDKTSCSATPSIGLVTWLLVLCLALLVMLYAAHQTKRLLGSENNEGQTQRRLPNIIESTIIRTIYWVCLTLALMLAITIFVHFFTHVVDQSQLTWITLVSRDLKHILILTHLDPKLLAIVLLCSVTLAFVFIQHRRVIFECITILTRFSSYVLFRLPIRLLLDPPCRACGHLTCTSSYCKAFFCLLTYTGLCITLPSVYYYLILNESFTSITLQNVLVITYIPFYIMAFVVYLLSTTINWLLENIAGCCCTEKHFTNNKENSHAMCGHRYRKTYSVLYYYT